MGLVPASALGLLRIEDRRVGLVRPVDLDRGDVISTGRGKGGGVRNMHEHQTKRLTGRGSPRASARAMHHVQTVQINTLLLLGIYELVQLQSQGAQMLLIIGAALVVPLPELNLTPEILHLVTMLLDDGILLTTVAILGPASPGSHAGRRAKGKGGGKECQSKGARRRDGARESLGDAHLGLLSVGLPLAWVWGKGRGRSFRTCLTRERVQRGQHVKPGFAHNRED